MKVWEVNYWASDFPPAFIGKTLRYRRFKWRWTARLFRWWLIHGPVWGMVVFTPINPVRRITILH